MFKLRGIVSCHLSFQLELTCLVQDGGDGGCGRGEKGGGDGGWSVSFQYMHRGLLVGATCVALRPFCLFRTTIMLYSCRWGVSASPRLLSH